MAQPLQQKSFYFIVSKTKKRYDQPLMVCRTEEQIFEDDVFPNGYGFNVLGNEDTLEYLHEWPEAEWEFVLIPEPA